MGQTPKQMHTGQYPINLPTQPLRDQYPDPKYIYLQSRGSPLQSLLVQAPLYTNFKLQPNPLKSDRSRQEFNHPFLFCLKFYCKMECPYLMSIKNFLVSWFPHMPNQLLSGSKWFCFRLRAVYVACGIYPCRFVLFLKLKAEKEFTKWNRPEQTPANTQHWGNKTQWRKQELNKKIKHLGVCFICVGPLHNLEPQQKSAGKKCLDLGERALSVAT